LGNKMEIEVLKNISIFFINFCQTYLFIH